MYFTDRGIEELDERRGDEQVTLGWLAERLRDFVDQNPDFETPVEQLATWLARMSTTMTTARAAEWPTPATSGSASSATPSSPASVTQGARPGRPGGRARRRPPGSLDGVPARIRGEATEEIVVRMPMECAPASPAATSTGSSSPPASPTPTAASPLARSVAALEFGLSSVSVPALVVGPPPVGDEAMVARIGELDAAWSALCASRGVPYIETFGPLASRAAWQRARADDGTHLDQARLWVAGVSGAERWLRPLVEVQAPRTPVKDRRVPCATSDRWLGRLLVLAVEGRGVGVLLLPILLSRERAPQADRRALRADGTA